MRRLGARFATVRFGRTAIPLPTRSNTRSPFRRNVARLSPRCAGAYLWPRLSAFSAVAKQVSPLLNTGRRQVRSCFNRPINKRPRICTRGGACDALFVAETPPRTKSQPAPSGWSQPSIGARSGRHAVGHPNGCSSNVERRPLRATEAAASSSNWVRCSDAPHPCQSISKSFFVCLRSGTTRDSGGPLLDLPEYVVVDSVAPN